MHVHSCLYPLLPGTYLVLVATSLTSFPPGCWFIKQREKNVGTSRLKVPAACTNQKLSKTTIYRYITPFWTKIRKMFSQPQLKPFELESTKACKYLETKNCNNFKYISYDVELLKSFILHFSGLKRHYIFYHVYIILGSNCKHLENIASFSIVSPIYYAN